MNEIEKQILWNQKAIITNLQNRAGEDEILFFQDCLEKTTKLLNPKQTEESVCNMEEVAKRGREE